MRKPRFIRPFGHGALLLEWEQRIDPEIGRSVHLYARELRTRPEVEECIPAYASLLVRIAGNSQAVERVRASIYTLQPATTADLGFHHELPVCYGGQYGPDLNWVSEYGRLSPTEVIRLHTETTYLVYFLGFRVGFGFMGEVDGRLEVPRRESPRTRVPGGSVGLASRQTGVYPGDTPGGWQLIGACPLPLLGSPGDLTRLRAGDRVTFRSISTEEYEHLLKDPAPWPRR